MTDAHHYDFQLRQRITANALNEQVAWASRQVHELGRRMLAGNTGSPANVTGVVSGLEVSVQGGSMNTQIGGGLALYYDSTKAVPESRHRWIEVFDDAPITLTHDPGDASPRWDVIEIAPGSTSGLGQILDFFNPATGVFVPALSNPLKVCSPTATIRKGTPAASPKFPAGAAGCIPLAYVYVPAGAVTLGTTDVLFCRPLLRPPAGVVTPTVIVPGVVTQVEPTIRGGGLGVPAAGGLSGELGLDLEGLLPDSHVRFQIPTGTALALSINNMDGAALPGTSRCVYFYLVPPSKVYPTGYDAFVGEREFYIRNQTRIASGGYAFEQRHGIVVVSDKAPRTSNRGQPATSSTFSINHPTFGAVSIDTDYSVYIGSAFYDVFLAQLVPQRVFGAHVGGPRKTGVKIDGDFPVVAPTLYSLGSSYVGDDDFALPAHVRRVRVIGAWDIDLGEWAVLNLTDQFETSGSNPPYPTWTFINSAGGLGNTGIDTWVHLNTSQQVVVTLADYGAGGDAFLYAYEWVDPILAAR